MHKITFAIVSASKGKAHLTIERTPRRTLCGISALGVMEAAPSEIHLSRSEASADINNVGGCRKCGKIIGDEGRIARMAFRRCLDATTGMLPE